MAFVLGLILTFTFGVGIGAWAMFDWLRYRGQMTAVRQHSEQMTKTVIEQMLDDYNAVSPGHLMMVRQPDDSDDAA